MQFSQVQVKEGHYHREKYETLDRFISYWYQIELIRSLQPKTVLEVGLGNGLVAEYLKRMNVEVTTCDIDSSLSPDHVADIRKLPFPDDSFDVATACEVLEHLPFEDFPKGLAELSRVTKKFTVISLPYRHASIQVAMKFPLVRTLLKKSCVDFCVRIPLRFEGFESSRQHYWEIDRSRYRLKEIRQHLERSFMIRKEVRPILDSYHQFFVLEKKRK